MKVILGVEDHAEDDPLTVCTDEFSAYTFLEDDDRFQRKTVTHGEGEFATEDGDVHVEDEALKTMIRKTL